MSTRAPTPATLARACLKALKKPINKLNKKEGKIAVLSCEILPHEYAVRIKFTWPSGKGLATKLTVPAASAPASSPEFLVETVAPALLMAFEAHTQCGKLYSVADSAKDDTVSDISN